MSIQKIFFCLFVILIGNTTIYRTNFLAGFFTMKSDAFRAKICFNFVKIFAFDDCCVRAFWLTYSTVDTFVSN